MSLPRLRPLCASTLLTCVSRFTPQGRLFAVLPKGVWELCPGWVATPGGLTLLWPWPYMKVQAWR